MNLILQIEIITILKVVHLLGLVLGFGGAVYCDLIILRNGVARKINDDLVTQVSNFSRIVNVGLILLWLSGSLLAWLIIQDNPKFWGNEKFWAKVAMVSILTVNGIIVHRFVLAQIRKRKGKRLFETSSVRSIVFMSLFGAISVSSWCIPFLLGVAPELSYKFPIWSFLVHYALTVLFALTAISLVCYSVESNKRRQYDNQDLNPFSYHG